MEMASGCPSHYNFLCIDLLLIFNQSKLLKSMLSCKINAQIK